MRYLYVFIGFIVFIFMTLSCGNNHPARELETRLRADEIGSGPSDDHRSHPRNDSGRSTGNDGVIGSTTTNKDQFKNPPPPPPPLSVTSAKGPIGIENSGNSCYANASTQLLMLLPKEYWRYGRIKYINSDSAVNENLITKGEQDFLKAVYGLRDSYFRLTHPHLLSKALRKVINIGYENKIYPGFSGKYSQEDAHEFTIGITGLLDGGGFPSFKFANMYKFVLDGEEKTKVTAPNPEDFVLHIPRSKKSLTIQELFQENLGRETQIHEYQYDEGVDAKVDAKKTRRLSGKAEFLFAMIYRFESVKNSSGRYTYERRDDVIDLDAGVVDFAPYLDTDSKTENDRFEIVGIILQSGTLHSGHYRAAVRYKEQWFLANDSSTKKITWEQAKKEAEIQSYILLLKRMGAKA